ncbi:hypothetical protein TPY_2778 [Sulfobacillus acidophilus TPY]|nr:hypothetical protein TPY_2778 [Sulfobacillus acidophilus TPY]
MDDVAQKVGVVPETWAAWESGRDPIPLDALSRAAKAFGLPLTALLNGLRPSPAPSRSRDPLDKPLREFLPVRPIPLLGRVVAGIPVEAQEDRRGEIWIPQGGAGRLRRGSAWG